MGWKEAKISSPDSVGAFKNGRGHPRKELQPPLAINSSHLNKQKHTLWVCLDGALFLPCLGGTLLWGAFRWQYAVAVRVRFFLHLQCASNATSFSPIFFEKQLWICFSAGGMEKCVFSWALLQGSVPAPLKYYNAHTWHSRKTGNGECNDREDAWSFHVWKILRQHAGLKTHGEMEKMEEETCIRLKPLTTMNSWDYAAESWNTRTAEVTRYNCSWILPLLICG